MMQFSMTVEFDDAKIILIMNRAFSLKALAKFFVPGIIISSLPAIFGATTESTLNRISSIVGTIIIIIGLTLLYNMAFPDRTNYIFDEKGITAIYKKEKKLMTERNNIAKIEKIPSPYTADRTDLNYLKIHLKKVQVGRPDFFYIQLYRYANPEEEYSLEDAIQSHFKAHYSS